MSLYATFPLIFKLRTFFYGYPADTLVWLWHLWWLKFSWLKGIPSDFVSVFAYPYGLSTPPLSLLWQLFNIAASILFGEVVAYNLQIILSFVLSAMAMYYLTLRFIKNNAVAFFCAAAFMLCPYRFARSWDHLSLSNTHWLVFFILALFDLHQKRTYRSAIVCGLCVGLISHLSNLYYLYFAIIFSVLFILYRLVFRILVARKIEVKDGVRTLKLSVIVIIVAIIMILPQIRGVLPQVSGGPQGNGIARPFGQLFADSATPFNYFLPAVYNPVLGKITEPFLGTFLYGENSGGEQSLYLGIIPLFLAFIGVRRWRQRKKYGRSNPDDDFVVSFFIFSFFAFMIISFSPYWGDKSGFFIPFPSYFLFRIFPMFRNYARFGVLVMVSVCVLAGFGLRDILAQIKPGKKRVFLYGILFVLMLFEFMNFPPFKITDANNVSEAYKWLKMQPEDVVIAEYPVDADERWYLFYQRIHEKRMINYFAPGTKSFEIKKKISDIEQVYVPGILKFLGVNYVLIHKDKYLGYEGGEILGKIPDLSTQKGMSLVKSFPDIDIYSISAKPVDPDGVEIKKVKSEKSQYVAKVLLPRVDKMPVGLEKAVHWNYVVKYLHFIPVLEINIFSDGTKQFFGHEVILVKAFMKNTKLIAGFFNCKGNLESYFDPVYLFSRRYKEVIKTKNRDAKEKIVFFDQEKEIMRMGDELIKIKPYTQDPLSAIFFFSSLSFEQDQQMDVFINAGRTINKLSVKVVGMEKINLGGKDYNCWKLKGEYFNMKHEIKKFANITLWFDTSRGQKLLLLRAFSKAGLISLEYAGYGQDS